MDPKSVAHARGADLSAPCPLQSPERSTMDRRKKVNRPPHPVVRRRIAPHLGEALRVSAREPLKELEEFVGPGNTMRFHTERTLDRNQSCRTLLQTAAINSRIRPQKVRRIRQFFTKA